MYADKLVLRNFRNYDKAEVSFSPHMNLITGNNAQGKTNLLESLVVSSLTKSHRMSDDRQLIKIGNESARISCVYDDGQKHRLDVVIHQGGKTLLVNGQPVKKSSAFIGQMNVILFSPDDLRIFKDSPRERRRLLDQSISGISGRYLGNLSQYAALIKERNALLKQPKVDPMMLDTLDDQLMTLAVPITRARRAFIEEINQYLPRLFHTLSQSDAKAEIRYRCCVEADTKEAYQALYQQNRVKDLEYRVTNVGPHREDLLFMLDDQNALEYASQGQKRMILLAFRMSLLKLIQHHTGQTPILLLDDVLSELDQTRQQILIRMIPKNCQCILTATDIPSVLDGLSYQEYVIHNGTIVMKKGTI